VPESKLRKEAVEKKKQAAKAAIAEAKKAPKAAPTGKAKGTGAWVVPSFLTVLILGIAWLVVYYITGSLGIYIPGMSDLQGWNIIIGMALIAAAFIISTQWGKKG
jgi:hypothetical protein